MIWIITFILGLLGLYFLVGEWLHKRNSTEKTNKKMTYNEIMLFFAIRMISVGALIWLLGYSVGLGISSIFEPEKVYSFAGIISLTLGMGHCFGLVGLLAGFYLALIQYFRLTEDESV